MRSSRRTAVWSVTMLVCALSAFEAVAGNEACKILTVEKFSEIMGYKARVTGSSQATCLYGGAAGGGGMLMILSEDASPQMLAAVDREGATLRGEGDKAGATFSKGKTVFSLALKKSDASKLGALVAEVKRNLK